MSGLWASNAGSPVLVPPLLLCLASQWFWKAGDPFLTSAEIAQQVDIKLGQVRGQGPVCDCRCCCRCCAAPHATPNRPLQGANLIFNVPPNSSAAIPDEFVQASLRRIFCNCFRGSLRPLTSPVRSNWRGSQRPATRRTPRQRLCSALPSQPCAPT